VLAIEKCVYTDVNSAKITPGTPPLTTNRDAVFYSLHNLLTTVVGERLNEVTYGVNLPDNLFEQVDDTTAYEIRFGIINAVMAWEPRVTTNLTETVITPLPDDNAYDMHLVFDLVGLDDTSLIISGIYKKQFTKDLAGS